MSDALLDVVIDTDVTNEVDDQFAVVWALLRPDRLRVVGLHACPYGLSPALYEPGSGLLTELDRRHLERARTAHGWAPGDDPVRDPEQGAEAARVELLRIRELAGVDVPVVAGAPRYLPDEQTPVDCAAARELIRLAHQEREGLLQVVGIGCATNIASALLLDPSIADRIQVVWTAAYPGFWPYENASYNLAQDVAAARVLFESAASLLYVPGYYVGEELRTSGPELQAYVAGVGPLGDYLWDTVRSHPLFRLDRPGTSKVIWDLAAIAVLLSEQWTTVRTVPRPTLDAELRWVPGRAGATMREAHDLDRDAVFGDLFARLASVTVG